MESTDLLQKTALMIDSNDNVAVALTDLKQGDLVRIRFNNQEETIQALEDIAFGHKIALRDIGENECVLKYGEEIGKMKEPVQKGGYIHNHNMYCDRGMK
jgi:altronate dehydratase small subunit